MTNSNSSEMVRKYLNEWKEEKEYAKENGGNSDFSWHIHDRELISIQNALRVVYTPEAKALLSDKERKEVEEILSYDLTD